MSPKPIVNDTPVANIDELRTVTTAIVERQHPRSGRELSDEDLARLKRSIISGWSALERRLGRIP